MRPSSSRALTLWISLFCLLAALFGFDGLASAQANAGSKRELSQQPLLSPHPVASVAAARRATRNAPPPLTSDSWTGTAGGNNWSSAGNWNNGEPTSADAVTIGTATANVNMDTAGTFGTLTLSGSGDTLKILTGNILTADGNITNAGTITLNSTGAPTELVLGANVTLSGAGTVTLSNNVNNVIQGSATANTLTNQQTIQGAGNIGNGSMTLVNSGTINANQSAGLTIQANGGTTNTGTLEATAGSTLALVGMTVTNTGGTIAANGSTVQLFGTTVNGGAETLTGASTLQLNNSTIHGGSTLTNSATGTIEVANGSNTLGGTINNSAGGTIKIDNGAVLNLEAGTYSQLGTVQLNSTGNFTELGTVGNVTLSGGTLTLSNNVNNVIQGSATTDTLTNQGTIQGAGNIGNGQMTLVNSGTINSNQTAGLTIEANGGTTNTGTLEATAGSTLAMIGMTVTNTGGTISANGSTLQLIGTTVNGGAETLTGASTLQLNSSTIHGGSTLTNSATGTIEVANGTNVLGGTINNSAGGTLKIDNGATLNLEAGTYSQLGTVQLNSTGNATQLGTVGNVTLSGETLTLSNNVNNVIQGSATTDTLTNQGTIQGAGNIGNGQMTLVNSGTINSNQTAGLTIQANGGTTNTGTLEATAGSTLSLIGMTVTNTGGTISANGSTLVATGTTINGGAVTLTGASTLQMNTSTIHGGSTLTNSATGTIEVANGTNVLGGTINNSAGGTLKIDNGATLNLEAGTYSQLGTVQLNSTGNATQLGTIGNVTLSGGTVTLSNNVNNVIQGSATTDTLTNQGTIQGAGNIGNGQMTLVNSGTINSNQTAGLTIQANGGTTNTGTLEATAGSTLALIGMTVTNTGGTISANGGTLQLIGTTVNGGAETLTGASTLQLNSSTIHGGSTLTNSATGTIEVANGTNVLGGTINNSAGGTLKIDNGATLNLEAGTYSQLGTVQLNATANSTGLVLGGNVTLSGGTVTLSNNVNNFIQGGVTANTLTNQETIQGAGNIGNGSMTLVNSGTINSNQTAGLTIQANGGATNTGTLEATAGSTLGLLGMTVSNTGGTISANGSTLVATGTTINGGAVTLTGASTLQLNSSTFHGGSTLTNSATGTIEVANGTNVLGGTINNSAGGTLKIDNGATLNLEAGTYSQMGAVQLNATANSTGLIIGTAAHQTVTLSGGTVTLSNNANNFIQGAVSTDTLTNQGTIQGAGNIGSGQMGLVNSGTINANASNNLIISVSSSDFHNTGTIEAAGGTLTILGPGTTFFTNDNQTTNTLSGGTYIANGNNIQWAAGSGGITTLAANVTEENGGQLFNTTNNGNALATLTSITSAGALTIGGVAFTDAGTFSNAGSLTILAGESFTVGSLTQINGSGSLTAGTYVLDANLNLSGATQTITTNAANLTLAGGTIENANSTNALAGLATNSGTLTIAGTSNNLTTSAASFSNSGTLTINAGNSFTAPALTQISGSTLSGGTFVLAGNLDLTTSGISVTTNSSTLTLEGGTINSNGVNALSALASNTKSLTIAGTSNNLSTTAASFSNTGTLTINATDSYTAGNLTQVSSGTLTAGTYVLAGNLDLTTAGIAITKNAATLTLEGGTINSNGVNALSALATNTGKLTIAGTGNNVSTTAASFSNTGTLTINSGDSFTAPALTQISGSTLTAGTFVLGGNLDLTAAANITTNSTNLTLEGGTIQTGSTNDLANLSSNTKSLTLSSNANFTAAGNFSNSGTLIISAGSAFTLTGSNTLTNLASGTLTGGTYNIGGTLQLTSANGGITANAANLTLTGTSAKIMDGSTNALAGFNNNTGTFALASSAALTTASGNFSDSGTVTVAKGTTLTVGGTGNSYNQTAGTTTVDGTLSGGTSGAVNVTGGTILGAGTVKANTSVGNASGAAATINVGDGGKSGLLAITGTYTQLATGNMTGFINGTKAGTGFSQINITGTAALAGTINFTVAAAFQSSLTVGETFTVLNASSVTGTFSNSTIAINSSFHFTVSYTATGVVLTVASGASAPNSGNSALPAAQMAVVNTKRPAAAATTKSKNLVLVSGQRHRIDGANKFAKPIMVASWPQRTGLSNTVLARGPEMMNGLRSWERIPVASAIQARPLVVVGPDPRAVNADSSHLTLPTSDLRMGQNQAIGVHSPLAGWMGTSGNRRVPVKIMQPMLPRITR